MKRLIDTRHVHLHLSRAVRPPIDPYWIVHTRGIQLTLTTSNWGRAWAIEFPTARFDDSPIDPTDPTDLRVPSFERVTNIDFGDDDG